MKPVIVPKLLPCLMPLIVLAALAVLLSTTGSPWLIAALLAEAASLLFRVAMESGAYPLSGAPLFLSASQLCGLLFSVCLFGFALTWQPHATARRGAP